MCNFTDKIQEIFESSISDEQKEIAILDEVLKEDMLLMLESNEIGLSMTDLGLPADFKLDMSYAHIIEDLEMFSVPGVSTVSNTTPPKFKDGPGKGLGKGKVNVYKYASTKYNSSNLGPNSRSFCKRLVAITNQRLLTFEDIQNLNSQNPGFGKGGTDNYSVFKFRGGTNCLHTWFKFVFDFETKTFVKAPVNLQPTQVPLR